MPSTIQLNFPGTIRATPVPCVNFEKRPVFDDTLEKTLARVLRSVLLYDNAVLIARRNVWTNDAGGLNPDIKSDDPEG
jgi:hypothetical protein